MAQKKNKLVWSKLDKLSQINFVLTLYPSIMYVFLGIDDGFIILKKPSLSLRPVKGDWEKKDFYIGDEVSRCVIIHGDSVFVDGKDREVEEYLKKYKGNIDRAVEFLLHTIVDFYDFKQIGKSKLVFQRLIRRSNLKITKSDEYVAIMAFLKDSGCLKSSKGRKTKVLSEECESLLVKLASEGKSCDVIASEIFYQQFKKCMKNSRLRFLEKEEIKTLLENCSEHIKPIVIVALNTGMRKSELFNLKWHDIDYKREIIHLLVTKNNEKREIPMNSLVKSTIIKVKKHTKSNYVFCKNDGSPYTNIRRAFKTALKRANIHDCSLHTLRHSFGSHLVMSGIDLNTVRVLLGHKDIKMTTRYAHLSPNFKKRAVEVLVSQNTAQIDTNTVISQETVLV